VRDTGIGIAPEDLPHVFERFYRSDKARARETGGAGLGLAIAHWIADVHDATLTVDSELGRGAVFRVAFSQRTRGDRLA
jgi:signal transduction histidine kinase